MSARTEQEILAAAGIAFVDTKSGKYATAGASTLKHHTQTHQAGCAGQSAAANPSDSHDDLLCR
jgi:hypothetical protein